MLLAGGRMGYRRSAQGARGRAGGCAEPGRCRAGGGAEPGAVPTGGRPTVGPASLSSWCVASRRVAALPTRSRRKYSWARRTLPWRTTSIFSMRGLLILNVRSTPTPLAIRRTVIDRVMPPPRRRMTVPSNTWIRSRLPSTTLADTFTVSPVASSGRSVRSWSATISSRTFTVGVPGLMGSAWLQMDRWSGGRTAGQRRSIARGHRRTGPQASTSGSRATDSSRRISSSSAASSADLARPASRSGRRRRVRRSDSRNRQRRTSSWWPDTRTAGTPAPWNRAVACTGGIRGARPQSSPPPSKRHRWRPAGVAGPRRRRRGQAARHRSGRSRRSRARGRRDRDGRSSTPS